jgi:aspartate/methionine/tyrosine aminotransferase
MKLKELGVDELKSMQNSLQKEYNELKAMGLKLDMSRGKPAGEQLNLSNDILTEPLDNYITKEGVDVRNYGILDGIKECKDLFSDLLDIPEKNIIIGGNSSLNLIYDTFARFYIFGSLGSKPWGLVEGRKFLCPVPGYDRHFTILDEFGFEMITVPMTQNGPDMDVVEKLVKDDPTIKGIMCVPLYSNPNGVCYSDEVVDRLAKMPTAAEDFKIFWDNAYAIHHVYEEVKLYNIFDACAKYNTQQRIVYFFSTSKITFPGSGVALMAACDECIEEIKYHFGKQTIGHNKINQLRTVNFFKNADGIKVHMKKLGDMLKEKFDIVLNKFDEEFKDSDMLSWTNPKGGYFVSVDTMDGCAKETVRLAKECGLVLTGAGATYPHGNDPHDSNLRIAPSYPNCEELKKAINVFCVCLKLAEVNKLLELNAH